MLKAISSIRPIQSEEAGMDYGLTKIEKLMLVNLAPTALVDLNIVSGDLSTFLGSHSPIALLIQIIDDLDVRFESEAQEEILGIFANNMQAAGVTRQADNAMNIVKEEGEEMKHAEEEADQHMEELDEEVYEEEHYNQEDIMPDEENDLSE